MKNSKSCHTKKADLRATINRLKTAQHQLIMSTKETLKRTYYALTVTGVMVFITLFVIVWPFSFYDEPTESLWLYQCISFSALLSLGVCWIMTRHNKLSCLRWYAGIMIAASLIFVYLPLVQFHFMSRFYISLEVKTYILLAVYYLCVAVATFLSNTKYHNILPNQNKGMSMLFRVLSWAGQILSWGYGIAVLVTELWFSK